MAVILTFSPSQPGPASRFTVRARARLVTHRCEDASGHKHRQRFPLGSVRGVTYLDALCLHCGAHLIWVEEEGEETGTGPEENLAEAT
jgi:hypothetical protein